MANPKNAASEESAGKLHNQIFDILLEMTKPAEVEMEDGSIEKIYDKDYIRMALSALKDNKITVVETVENSAGKLRKQLAGKKKPRFGNVEPLYVTEEQANGTGK